MTRTEQPAAAGRTAPEADGARIETAFAQLVGRQATQAERERLHRLRNVLGLRDNDAFWSIVMALEHYDSLFREYPAQLSEATERALENVRAASAAAAAQEVAAVQRALAEKVAETSVALAHKLAERPMRVHRFTLALAAVVAFGALCVHAGYDLATGARPFWVAPADRRGGMQGLLAIVLSMPAGWMVFALLLPAAASGARLGWAVATDSMASHRERAVGWCVVALCLIGYGACGVMVVRAT